MSETKETTTEAVEAAETKTVVFDGEEYVINVSPLSDVDVLEAYEDEKYVNVCRTVLGPAQWRTFKSKKRKTTELFDLLSVIFVDDSE